LAAPPYAAAIVESALKCSPVAAGHAEEERWQRRGRVRRREAIGCTGLEASVWASLEEEEITNQATYISVTDRFQPGLLAP
jgi:hypothetical protein